MSIRQQIRDYEELLRKPEIVDPTVVVEPPVLQCAMEHPSEILRQGERSGEIHFEYAPEKFMFLRDWLREAK